MYVGGDYSPDYSGCNLAGELAPIVKQFRTNDKTSPLILLLRKGVNPSQTFSADLNRDGRPDWLLWLPELPDKALLLLSTKDHYLFSMPDVAAPGNTGSVATVKLPNNAGIALASIYFDSQPRDGESSEPCGPGQPFGSINLSLVSTGRLEPAGTYLLCEPRSLAQIFPTPKKLHAWNSIDYQAAVEAVFTWSPDHGTYVIPHGPTSKEDRANTCSMQPEGFCGFDPQYPHALKLLNTLLANPPQGTSPMFLAGARYSRALLLQRLGYWRDALKDLIILYKDAPSRSWKSLAGLHLTINSESQGD